MSPPPPYSFLRRTRNIITTWTRRFGEAALEKTEQELVRKINDVLEDVSLPPTLELADESLNILGNAENVLKNNYVNDRVLNEKNIEDIKGEHTFDKIKNKLDEGHVPPSFEFFHGDENEHFCPSCNILNLNENNSVFIDFICSEKGEQILNSNNLSIHIETGQHLR